MATTENEDRIREMEASLAWWKDHADALDRNWSNLSDMYLNTIREALRMPDATVPEMADAIYTLRAGAVVAAHPSENEMTWPGESRQLSPGR